MPSQHTTPRICSIDGCGGKAVGRGWCMKHWQRWKSSGDPLRRRNLRYMPDMDRFLAQVNKQQIGCWLWTGRLSRLGYGKMRFRGQHLGAHRVAWLLLRGDIPPGLFVCHRCDVPACVNPDHLFLGTAADNNHDRDAKGRTAKGDRGGSHLHPEMFPRGDAHWTHQKPWCIARGERITLAKLDAAKVVEIRRRHSAGETNPALARVFGVDTSAIWLVVRYKTWKHIP